MVETMKGIDESSRNISDTIQVIDGIVLQTNIPALEAADEAPRAVEITVVVNGVRSLACRSA